MRYMKNKPVVHSLGHAALVFMYVSGVSWLLFNSERFFGNNKPDTFWIPVMMLMLFVLSAAIVGTLVLGRPILMYLDGQKKEAVHFLSYTLGWLFLITLCMWFGRLLSI